MLRSPSRPRHVLPVLLTAIAVTAIHRGTFAQAVPGTPFGVAAARVPVGGESADWVYQSGGMRVMEREGRTFYPVFSNSRFLERAAETLLDIEPPTPREIDVLFLFRGTAPLELTVFTPAPHQVALVPRAEPERIQNRLWQRWWRGFVSAADRQEKEGDHPPLVHTYLTAMLSQRLGHRLPLLAARRESTEGVPASLQLLFGVERLRDSALWHAMVSREEAADSSLQPLPASPNWVEHPASVEADDDVSVEPIAMHVPADCFYIRFGGFENYLWVRDLTREFGGDLGRMITLRGTDPQLDQRIQRRLALTDSVLVDLLGAHVTADMALIGRDMFLREGPALGVLILARNSTALRAGLTQQRAQALAAESENGATQETIQIAGRDVSFLSTPDNRLRSFYVSDGDYHLITSSQAIAERFLATGLGEDSLGASAEFRAARTAMPVSRGDTVFAYFSTAFFRGLFSPQYQIELGRRLQAVADIELLQLAGLAARAEGSPRTEIDDLVANGLLPAGFGKRADGSGPIQESHRAYDSLRGSRGDFLPVPDVTLRGATPGEVARYRELTRTIEGRWRRLDPLVVALRRDGTESKDQERVSIDALVSPLYEEKYGWIFSLLGPPSTQEVVSGTDPLITAQASLIGGTLFSDTPVHHLFIGVEDMPASGASSPSNLLQSLRLLRRVPGYLGAWPKPGFLDRLPGWLVGTSGPDGYSQLPLGAWRWQDGDFSLLSFRREVLERVVTQLRIEERASPAQIRIHARDLSQSQLQDWIRSLSEDRARRVTRGNIRLLHLLSNQLGVPREEAFEVANGVLDTQLVSVPTGKFELATLDGGLSIWQASTRRDGGETTASVDAVPLLQWFRGLDVTLLKQSDQLELHAQIDIHRQAAPMSGTFPLLNGLLRGISKPASPEKPSASP